MAGTARRVTRRRPGRRRLDPGARRLELIEAAERVLRRRGAVDTRVEDIVREAGAAKGTFYLYFQSWDDLLVAVRERIFAAFETGAAAASVPTSAAGWWVLTDAMAVGFVDFVLGLEGLHDAVFHGPFADRRPLAAEAGAEARIAAFIEAGTAAGVFRGLDPKPAARLLFALLHETADAIAEGEDRESALAMLMTLLHRCLGDTGGFIATPVGPDTTASKHAGRR